MESWWPLHATLCVLCTALIYGPLLRAPLLYDDVAAVEKNPDVNLPLSRSLFENDFWGTPLKSAFSHQSYRPVTVLTFRLAGDVFLQRLLNAGLHVANTLLLTGLIRREAGPGAARVAGILFCLHPLHTETVIQLVGRAELLSAMFYLLCISGRGGYVVAVLCTALAMFSKEQGVTALAVKTSLDVIRHLSGQRDRGLWRKLLASTVATLGLLTVRLAISGRAPAFHVLDNPARVLQSPWRQINFAYLALFNVNLLLNPHRQSCDYSFKSVPPIESFTDPRLLQLVAFTAVSFTAVATLLGNLKQQQHQTTSGCSDVSEKVLVNNNNNNYILCASEESKQKCIVPTSTTTTTTQRRCAMLPLAGLAMVLLPWLPASNLVFYVGFVVAERVLYLPAMGMCFLVAIGYEKLRGVLHKRHFSLIRNWLIFLSCVLFVTSALRSRQWQSGVKIFGAGIRNYPENIKLWNNLGKAFELEGDFHLALSCFDRSLAVRDDLRAHWYKARLLTKLDKVELARDVYRRKHRDVLAGLRNTARISREAILFMVDYVRLLMKVDELEEARALIDEVLTLAPPAVELRIVAGELFYQMDQKSLAEDSYRKALAIDPRATDVYYNLGVLLMERGVTDSAATMFRHCIALNPSHEPSRVNLNVLQTNTEDSTMMTLYKDAMDALREGSYTAAESLLRRVLSRHPHHPSALYNLALLYTQLGRPATSSLAFLDRLLAYRPSHSKGLLLKANIMHRQVGDIDAAVKLYARAYSVDKSLESPLEALCDLSPRTAFALGGSCDRDVDVVQVVPQQQSPQQQQQQQQPEQPQLQAQSSMPLEHRFKPTEHSDLPNFNRQKHVVF